MSLLPNVILSILAMGLVSCGSVGWVSHISLHYLYYDVPNSNALSYPPVFICVVLEYTYISRAYRVLYIGCSALLLGHMGCVVGVWRLLIDDSACLLDISWVI